MKNFDSILDVITTKYDHKDILGTHISKNDFVSFRGKSALTVGIVININSKKISIGYLNNGFKKVNFETTCKYPEEIIIINEILPDTMKTDLINACENHFNIKKNTPINKSITCAYHNINTDECGFMFLQYSYLNNSNKAFKECISKLNIDSNLELFVLNKELEFEPIDFIKSKNIQLNNSYNYEFTNICLPNVTEDLSQFIKNYSTSTTKKITPEYSKQHMICWLDKALTRESHVYYGNLRNLMIERSEKIPGALDEKVQVAYHINLFDKKSCWRPNNYLKPGWNKFIRDNGFDTKYIKDERNFPSEY